MKRYPLRLKPGCVLSSKAFPKKIAAGMPRQSVLHFDSSLEAAEAVTLLVASGDVVLVKGSRGTRTDLVVERLTAVFG